MQKYSRQQLPSDDEPLGVLEIVSNGINRPPIKILESNLNFDPDNQRYAYCIVWTTLPLISCILPVIGHTGICGSDGVVHDFAGPYYVAVDNFAFGQPLKYVRLNNTQYSNIQWDEAVRKADEEYEKTMHNICCNNCHSHVAAVLNHLNYEGKSNWNMVSIWWMCILKSQYFSMGTFLKTYYMSIILFTILLIMNKL